MQKRYEWKSTKISLQLMVIVCCTVRYDCIQTSPTRIFVYSKNLEFHLAKQEKIDAHSKNIDALEFVFL